MQQIRELAARYEDFIQQEKKIGTFDPIIQPDNEASFIFTGNSAQKVSSAYKIFQQQIDQLNNEYLVLYQQGEQFPPISTSGNKDKMSTDLKQLESEYSQWTDQEIKTGDIIRVYNPDNVFYNTEFIGKSYALDQIKSRQVHYLWLAINGPSDAIVQQDVLALRKIETGQISLMDIATLPYYRADLRLAKYESPAYLYTLYSEQHKIIEIFPKKVPTTEYLTPIAPLTPAQLEQKARVFIAAISPEINLDALSAVPGSKVESFFFRWEDRTKPFLDDHLTYPFVQIGYNRDGELLNYYNTLPLSH